VTERGSRSASVPHRELMLKRGSLLSIGLMEVEEESLFDAGGSADNGGLFVRCVKVRLPISTQPRLPEATA
jgi:hypothetical protein